VTEGLLVEDVGQTVGRMQELAALGIRFSIDDFGTGYSNLAYLKKMPLYELKIDKSFMRDTPHDANGTAIVQSILAMAGHLGLRVVAEGIETDEQARFLAAHGGAAMQGYLFHRPMPLARLIERLDGAP
jgi:EAL domain-containing protein (putative c-di-GMP-specific phosphodiesterase class I)